MNGHSVLGILSFFKGIILFWFDLFRCNKVHSYKESKKVTMLIATESVNVDENFPQYFLLCMLNSYIRTFSFAI